MRKLIPLLVLVFAGIGGGLHAQVTIEGPRCVISGISYQYMIKGNRDTTAPMSICVTGGVLNTGGTCMPIDAPEGAVYVTWSDSGINRVDVTFSSGTTGLLVQRTVELVGGTVVEADKVQLYDSSNHNYSFHCTAAQGGSCEPNYVYQWQRSDDEVNWTDITGATGKDFFFSGSILVNTYFRRITKETNSNIMVYSDAGLLAVPF